MFVFKAAVVGAGTMGGEIAQVIAAADIPVVLKDVDQRFVDAGLQKAREVTQGQTAKLVKKERLTQEQADEQVEALLGRIHGTLDYELKERNVLTWLLDAMFVRRAIVASLRRTLSRFARERRGDMELEGESSR